MAELGEHSSVNCKEEEEEEGECSRVETNSSGEAECSFSESCSGGRRLERNDVLEAFAKEEHNKEMLEKKEKKKNETESEESLFVEENLAKSTREGEKNENVGCPNMENRLICDALEMCQLPAPGEMMRANTDEGNMCKGPDIEDRGEQQTNDEATHVQVISMDGGLSSPDAIEEESEEWSEDIVSPTLSLFLFNIIMPCLDLYFDTLLIQKLSPSHRGCLLVIVCALTVNFAFTCFAWWRFEPATQKNWSWIFLLLQLWPQLKAGQVK